MNRNYATLCKTLTGNNIDFERYPENHAVLANLELKNTRATLMIHAPPNEPFMSIMVILPIAMPPDRRAAVGELLHRVNYDLRVGNFEFSYDDGEVRFHLSVLLPNKNYNLSGKAILHWLAVAVHSLDGFCPTIVRVARSKISPAHAHEQSEAEFREYLQNLEKDTE
ncbi:MAG: YbjN domain-containing protein [Verrucomicrobiae bacterium]|nr:YbjN domain-containing protein [Verrucomicrobiae bacterium]